MVVNRSINGYGPPFKMSGIKKKWTKTTSKEKRDWAVVLLAEVADDINKNVPKSKLITPSKLADRYKISLTLARKVLKELEKEGKIVCLIKHSNLVAYGRPADVKEEVVEEKAQVEEKATKGKKGKK